MGCELNPGPLGLQSTTLPLCQSAPAVHVDFSCLFNTKTFFKSIPCISSTIHDCIYDRLLALNLIRLNQNFFIWIVMVSLDRRPVSSPF